MAWQPSVFSFPAQSIFQSRYQAFNDLIDDVGRRTFGEAGFAEGPIQRFDLMGVYAAVGFQSRAGQRVQKSGVSGNRCGPTGNRANHRLLESLICRTGRRCGGFGAPRGVPAGRGRRRGTRGGAISAPPWSASSSMTGCKRSWPVDRSMPGFAPIL